jgi:hypothetical protein
MAVVDQEKINYILSILKSMEYGSVLITVHDGQITQVDSTEKNRFVPAKKLVNKNK